MMFVAVGNSTVAITIGHSHVDRKRSRGHCETLASSLSTELASFCALAFTFPSGHWNVVVIELVQFVVIGGIGISLILYLGSTSNASNGIGWSGSIRR